MDDLKEVVARCHDGDDQHLGSAGTKKPGVTRRFVAVATTPIEKIIQADFTGKQSPDDDGKKTNQ